MSPIANGLISLEDREQVAEEEPAHHALGGF
jgi:hypothetical protein